MGPDVALSIDPAVGDTIAAVAFFVALLCGLVVVRELAKQPPAPPEAPHEPPKPKEKAMSAKQTSRAVSRLAAKVLRGGYRPTAAEIRTLAACALGQDETAAPKKVVTKAAAKKRA